MERLIIHIFGCVQGVGFRPFVYRLARRRHLAGSIRNTTSGVMIDVQGEENALAHFQKELVSDKPSGAVISEIASERTCLHEAHSFEIEASRSETDTALALLPDTAMCASCLQELFDSHNRRFRYPFIHCIACGPRFSLFTGMPFDRANTSMADFSMCQECRKEYGDPENRRFYSQTNCCPQCGPRLRLLNPEGRPLALDEEAVGAAVGLLQQGKIVAMKNTGGYQLFADAENDSAVRRLRLLKHRAAKPFALLMPSLGQVHQIAHLCQAAEQVLTSPAAPIVLVKKREGTCLIAPSVSCESPYYGIMIPHNALQILLLKSLSRPVVATSGNISGRPLCITEEEVFGQLGSIADAFLVHNRRIMHRLDDSIVHVMANQPVVIRRARGYIPYAIPIPNGSEPLFASGGQQKSSFAFINRSRIYMGQHMGDLEHAETCRAYDQEVEKWERLLAAKPTKAIADKHPAFYTNHYLERRKMQSTPIQHHQAHVWAGMIDNQLSPPFLGIAWDGTGWGEDGTAWGGEAFFVASDDSMQRIGSLYPFRLPGGEKAVREPRRSALGMLHSMALSDAWLEEAFTSKEVYILGKALNKGVHSPVCSSVGRLFDGVSALLGCCRVSQFEGQAALALEAIALKAESDSVQYRIPLLQQNELWLMDWRPMVKQMMEDRKKNIPVSEISLAFHEALSQCIVDLAKTVRLERVLLTGGVMQNKLLAEKAIVKLQKEGLIPYWHRNIPPNDGGLAVGQAVGGSATVA